MSRNFFARLFILAFVASSPAAFAEIHEIPLNAVMAPAIGYDNNDRIEVVVHGDLPNGCHTLARTEAVFDQANRTFLIKQFAKRKRDGICAQDATIPAQMKVVSPFTSLVQLDERNISVGEFLLAFVNRKGETVSRRLLISAAEALTQDEVPYATIGSVLTSPVVRPGDNARVTISGITTSTCFVRNPWRVEPIGDVYVIRPTLTYYSDRMCLQVLTPFEETLDIPGSPEKGFHLVHVRSTGRSVNQVFQVLAN